MTQPNRQSAAQPDGERVEAALRQMVRPAGSTQRVWQQIAARRLSAAPSPRRRLALWLVPAAAAAIVLLGVGLWRHYHPGQGAYPAPTLAGGGILGRNVEVATAGDPASLSLGGYCQVELSRDTRLRIEGSPHQEAVRLISGEVACEVDKGVGGFEVRSEIGNVVVHGTRFKVTLLDPIDSPIPYLGETPMSQRRLMVAVFSGLVVVSGTWGQTTLAAGQDMVFAAPVPGTAADAQTSAPASQPEEFNRGDFILLTAVRKARLTDEQQKKVQPILRRTLDSYDSMVKSRTETPLHKEYADAMAAARAAGVHPKDDPKCKEIADRLAKWEATEVKLVDKDESDLRQQALSQILPLLGEEQRRIVKLFIMQRTVLHDSHGEGFADGFIPGLEEQMLLTYAPGFDLTEQQYQTAIAALKPLVAQYKKAAKEQTGVRTSMPTTMTRRPNSPSAQKARMELDLKRHAVLKPSQKAMREAVEAVLTPDQKKALVDKRSKAAQSQAEAATKDAVAEIQKAELTDDQKQKANELASATCQAIVKLDPDDMGQAPQRALLNKLRNDLQNLLTDDQKDKLEAAAQAAAEKNKP